MRFVLFYHSLVSDWNHVSAHGLRGIANELLAQGHAVRILEPADGWSLHNLREQGGDGLIKAFHATCPGLRSSFYDPAALDLDDALSDADVVIAHEWTDPGLLQRLGQHRDQVGTYKLLFHDAPHRSHHARPLELRSQVLSNYDGVLAASDSLRRLYQLRGWARNVWTWREGVDTRIFRPRVADEPAPSLDLVWIGAWGSGRRTEEIDEYLLDPVRTLGLRARCYGERYPKDALSALRSSGIDYGGWIADFSIPTAYAAARFTINVPRRLSGDGIPHTPAIRVLQALACGMPVISAPWDECNTLFTPDIDLLIARDGREMARHMSTLQRDRELARFIGANGCQTVLTHHTCGHRAQELLAICHELGATGLPRADAQSAELPRVRKPQPLQSRIPAAWN